MSPAHHDYDAFRRTRAFGSLDGLRCLSILAVIWHHSGTRDHVWRGLQMGFLGVDLFFVISGFLIVTLLLREKSAAGTISLSKFYVRRTLRIFPLYYAVVLSLAAFYGFVNVQSTFGARFLGELPYYLTYTANFVPVAFAIVWSLSAEEQFYIFWPFVEAHLSRFVPAILLGLIIVNQIVNFPSGKEVISHLTGHSDWVTLSIAECTFTPILLGVAAAHMLHSERGFRLVSHFASHRFAPVFTLLTLAGLMTFAPVDISGLPRLAIQICMTALVVACVYREDHALSRILQFPPIPRIGKVSYGMYLFHIPLIVVAARLIHVNAEDGSILLFFVAVVLTAAAADISFRFFESPLLNLKSKYSVVHQAHV